MFRSLSLGEVPDSLTEYVRSLSKMSSTHRKGYAYSTHRLVNACAYAKETQWYFVENGSVLSFLHFICNSICFIMYNKAPNLTFISQANKIVL